MITQVDATNSQGAVLGLPLYDVLDGLVVEGIEGLDPVKATIVSSSFAQIDGTQYQSSRRDERNIKIRIGLEPDYVDTTVASLRKALYRYFMPKTAVNLRFYDDADNEYLISGRVESCDAPLFTDEPTMDVSILCFDPDFYDEDVTVISSNTVSDLTSTVINYDGTIETGIIFQLNVNHSINSFSIYNSTPDGTVYQLDFNAALVAGDVVKISTVPGSKYVTLTHLGVDTSVLYALTPQSNWIELQPGVNNLRVYTTGTAIPYTVSYTTKYGGL